MKIYHELLHSSREIPNGALLKRVTIRFGCQHGLQLTKKFGLVRYYNALDWIVVPRRGVRCLTKALGPSTIIAITIC